MKKILFTIAFVSVLLKIALALPTINNVIFEPSSDLWIGEELIVKVNCTDYSNDITSVKFSAIGDDGYRIPEKELSSQYGLFVTNIENLYLSYPNKFSANITCINSNYESDSQIKTFNVSSFTTVISSISPQTIYLGDLIEVDVIVKKNNERISSGVNFNIKLNNSTITPIVSPPYDPSKGWIIYLNAPNVSGQYSLFITSSYGRINDTKTISLTINEPVLLSIISLDKNLVRPEDIIKIQIKALEKGNVIGLNSENLEIKIGSAKAEIRSITPVSNYYNVEIVVPNLQPGSYQLNAYLKHGNYTYSTSTQIDYIVPIFGKIVDENGKGITVEFKFFANNVEKLRFYTDSAGAYNSYIAPGTYDLQLTFPQSVLYLKSINIGNFEDPVRYSYYNNIDVPGINLAGLYVYELAIPYSQATIEMKYNEGNILEENAIKVYKCEMWNNGRKACYGNWEEVEGNVDTVRNIVKVSTSRLSAYAIGTLKSLKIDFNLNKGNFSLRDLVRIRGVVTDGNGNMIDNSTVYVKLKGTNINLQTKTDSNGIFQIEFVGPSEEGSYTLILSAEKHPYIKFTTTKELKFEKSKDFSILFPDTVRINAGSNITQELVLTNIGQSDLYGLQIFITGLSSDYYSMENFVENLKAGETKKIPIRFSAPYDANQTTISASLTAFNDEVKKEKIFGFTILSANKTLGQSAIITGGAILTRMDWNWIFVLFFAATSFSFAFLLKERKVNKVRNEVRSLLFDLKNYLKNKPFVEQNMLDKKENG
jgi:hypothetical protein